MTYDVEVYEDEKGRQPYSNWVLSLKDKRALAKIGARVDRAQRGNFGDWKTIKDSGGVREMREHYSPGYRIFYGVIGSKIILLLAGSTKKDQKKTIAKAREYLEDYERRIS